MEEKQKQKQKQKQTATQSDAGQFFQPRKQTRTTARPRRNLRNIAVNRSYPTLRFAPEIHLHSLSRAAVINEPISWADYHRLDLLALAPDDFPFSGIICHIHSSSRQHYNIAELLVLYSSIAHGSDPCSLLDPTTNDCFASGSTGCDCVVFSFQRVSIRPTALVVKCGPWTRMNPPQWSFVLQGLDPQRRAWMTLTERCQELRPWLRWRAFMIDTDRWLRQFRFLYTGVVVLGVPSFSIEAFEIHGDVQL
jgi:hypothetical protein